jgi:hypothetical protein
MIIKRLKITNLSKENILRFLEHFVFVGMKLIQTIKCLFLINLLKN